MSPVMTADQNVLETYIALLFLVGTIEELSQW